MKIGNRNAIRPHPISYTQKKRPRKVVPGSLALGGVIRLDQNP